MLDVGIWGMEDIGLDGGDGWWRGEKVKLEKRG